MKSKVIALIGIDGSGKTTQSILLLENLKKHFNEESINYVWSRWEPFIFRPLIQYWKRKNKKKSEENYFQLKDKKTRFLQKPFLRVIWIWGWAIEYGLQIFFKVKLRGFAKNELIISDRYFYDSLIDQAINLNLSDEKIFQLLDGFWVKKIFPEPDLVIYIDCPEEIAFKRKQDVDSIDYLKDRRIIYLKIAEKRNWIVINGGDSIDQVKDSIKKTIEEGLNIRL